MKRKIFITALLSTLYFISHSQVDFSKKIVGTWAYINAKGDTEQFTVSENAWTYYSPKTFSGKWDISKSNKIHIIFHDKPREESFVKIISVNDTTMVIKQSPYKNMREPINFNCKRIK